MRIVLIKAINVIFFIFLIQLDEMDPAELFKSLNEVKNPKVTKFLDNKN